MLKYNPARSNLQKAAKISKIFLLTAVPEDSEIVMKKRTIAIGTAAGIGAAAAAVFGGAYTAFRMAFDPSSGEEKDDYHFPKSEQYDKYYEENIRRVRIFSELPWKHVETVSEDGLKLTGRYLHQSDNAPTAICFHGWHGTAIRDFCGGGPLILEQGYNMLLVDQRSHGDSEGKFLSFGILERKDVIRWIEYAIENSKCSDPKIVLYGVSMGAATVLMASGMALPPQVKAIAADCPYSSVEGIIKKVGRDRHLPIKPLWPFVRLGAKIFGRFDPCETTCMEQVSKCRLPILLIHGDADRFVPCEMSEEIKKAGLNIRREVFPGAGHGISYLVDTPRYRQILKEFTQQYVNS